MDAARTNDSSCPTAKCQPPSRQLTCIRDTSKWVSAQNNNNNSNTANKCKFDIPPTKREWQVLNKTKHSLQNYVIRLILGFSSYMWLDPSRVSLWSEWGMLGEQFTSPPKTTSDTHQLVCLRKLC